MSDRGHEEQLEAVLSQYIAQREEGVGPSRDAVLREHPQLRNDLLGYFRTEDLLDTRREARQRADGAERADPSRSLRNIGIPGYELLEEVGSGSQGVVFRARQLSTKRIVALKVIHAGALASAHTRRRFEAEVVLASRLRHPNIVSIYDKSEAAGFDFCVMEFVEGVPFDDHLTSQAMEVRETVQLFLQVCDGVHYAHQHGVIHRDLKPSNLMVDPSGAIRILDFGLAKPVTAEEGSPELSQPGVFRGTWYYASPEQVRADAHAIDVRSDVYSLGVILFEMLTDGLPYPITDEPTHIIARHILETAPLKASSIRADVDQDLDTILLRTLSKEPDRRYQSVGALADDVRRYLRGDALEARRDSKWYVLRKAYERHRLRFALAALALAALVIFSVTITVLYSQTVRARATTEARMSVVRNSQGFLLERLHELHRSANSLDRLLERAPHLRDEVRPPWPHEEAAMDRLSRIVHNMPPGLIAAIRGGSGTPADRARDWLDGTAAALDELADTLQHFSCSLNWELPPADHLVLATGLSSAAPAGQAANAFLARSIESARAEDHVAACRNLTAARRLRLDVGDVPSLLHTAVAIGIQQRIHETLQFLFAEDPANLTREPYRTLIRNEPPVPPIAPALALERQKIAQLIEHAVFSDSSLDGPGVDLVELDRLAGGLINASLSPSELDAAAAVTSPDEYLTVLDSFLREAGAWDDLPYADFVREVSQVDRRAERDRAWPIVRAFLPSIRAAYVRRIRANATRSALRFALAVASPPAPPGDVRSASTSASAAHEPWPDPWTGGVLRSRVTPVRIVIYSVNADGTDDGGVPGAWGDDGTDLIVLTLPR